MRRDVGTVDISSMHTSQTVGVAHAIFLCGRVRKNTGVSVGMKGGNIMMVVVIGAFLRIRPIGFVTLSCHLIVHPNVV